MLKMAIIITLYTL